MWLAAKSFKIPFAAGIPDMCALKRSRSSAHRVWEPNEMQCSSGCRMPPRPMNRRGGSPPTPPPPPPQNPLAALEQDNANMMAGITALLEQQATCPRLSYEEDVAERFQKKGPKEFVGTTDPLVAEGWIRSLEFIFAYMGITDTDRVNCATYMLRGDTALWWEGAARGVHIPTLTWTEFRRIFYAKYFTEDVRSRMIREFMSLCQGDKTVVEYVRQFEGVCHFVPLISDSPPEKLRQFVEGLKVDIKHDVRMTDVLTYESAVSRALRSEEGRREIQREQQGKRQFQAGYQRPSSQPPAKKQFTGLAKGPNTQQRPHQQRGGAPNAIGYPTCPKCQKMHSGPCLLGAGVCYHCREPGHQIANCPRKKNTAGRVFVMQAEEVDPDTSLITGEFVEEDVAPTGVADI
ncbi:uncharacterized protein [Henckelia pumila]|uniref:uncharacterized protein n=1 Tax=Henckelia pumila TaxID=405737 RepID=UPI003C6E3BD3